MPTPTDTTFIRVCMDRVSRIVMILPTRIRMSFNQDWLLLVHALAHLLPVLKTKGTTSIRYHLLVYLCSIITIKINLCFLLRWLKRLPPPPVLIPPNVSSLSYHPVHARRAPVLVLR